MAKVWDMHCDTLYRMRLADKEGTPVSFDSNRFMIDLERMKKGRYLLQCLACYVDLAQDGAAPLNACLELIDLYYHILEEYQDDLMQIKSPGDIRQLMSSNKIGTMLTVEEGAVCLDSPAVLRNLYRLGVRMMTLTWNFENGLASPNHVGSESTSWTGDINQKGLKEKGIAFLEEMERLHMIVDVSHLSDGGFYDVARYTKRPFAASHSNARSLCPHVRNLTDDMIRIIAGRGGVIGLNFCGDFLFPGTDRTHVISAVSDMVLHIRHIIRTGGEDVLALGTDFDGISGELELAGAQDMPLLADALEKEGFSEKLIDKIFFGNAMRFFSENL